MWQPFAAYLLHGGFAMQGWDQVIAQGKQIAAERRFFHWELEFPEVFFDQHGRLQGEGAGFDAVIGNPPYVHSGQISSLKPYLAEAHRAVYDGTADLYVYFYHQGVTLLRKERSFIRKFNSIHSMHSTAKACSPITKSFSFQPPICISWLS
jgi:hypothetical protein